MPTGSYAANGLLPWGKGDLKEWFAEGASQTIMFGERPQVCRSANGDIIYTLWGVGFYSPHMPTFATLTPADSPEFGSTGQIAPVFPLTNEFLVRIGCADAAATSPDFAFPIQRLYRNGSCDPRLPAALHRAGMNVGMADGRVLFMTHHTPIEIFWVACSPGTVEKP